jgi:trimeric autotransporter adhesin
MGRRVTIGRQTGAMYGQLSIDQGVITTLDNNQDITLDPAGTGEVVSLSNLELKTGSSVKYYDSDDSNYISFVSPALTTNTTYAWPGADGTNNQCLTSDGSGNLSWTDKGFAVANNNSAAESYLLFTASTTGSVTSANVANSGLVYTANAGTLKLDGMLIERTLQNIVTSSYTLTTADQNKVVIFNNSSAATVTIPNDSTASLPIGSVVYLYREGAGSVTISPAGGVSLTKQGSIAANEELYIRKRAANSWSVIASEQPPSASGGAESSASGFNIHQFTSGGTWTIG